MDRVETPEPQTPPNASSHVLPRAKVEGALEPVKEEVVQALLGAFEVRFYQRSMFLVSNSPIHQQQTVVKQQELTKSHSFQIVGLQNQIQALQNERLLELEDKTIILDELQNCRDEIVYLKGKLAGLTVEFYSSQPPTQKHRSYTPVWAFKWNDKHAYNSSSHRSDTLVPESESRTEQYNFEEGINGHSCTAEAIADQLLLEQRPQLIKGLVSFYVLLFP